MNNKLWRSRLGASCPSDLRNNIYDDLFACQVRRIDVIETARIFFALICQTGRAIDQFIPVSRNVQQ